MNLFSGFFSIRWLMKSLAEDTKRSTCDREHDFVAVVFNDLEQMRMPTLCRQRGKNKKTRK